MVRQARIEQLLSTEAPETIVEALAAARYGLRRARSMRDRGLLADMAEMLNRVAVLSDYVATHTRGASALRETESINREIKRTVERADARQEAPMIALLKVRASEVTTRDRIVHGLDSYTIKSLLITPGYIRIKTRGIGTLKLGRFQRVRILRDMGDML